MFFYFLNYFGCPFRHPNLMLEKTVHELYWNARNQLVIYTFKDSTIISAFLCYTILCSAYFSIAQNNNNIDNLDTVNTLWYICPYKNSKPDVQRTRVAKAVRINRVQNSCKFIFSSKRKCMRMVWYSINGFSLRCLL